MGDYTVRRVGNSQRASTAGVDAPGAAFLLPAWALRRLFYFQRKRCRGGISTSGVKEPGVFLPPVHGAIFFYFRCGRSVGGLSASGINARTAFLPVM